MTTPGFDPAVRASEAASVRVGASNVPMIAQIKAGRVANANNEYENFIPCSCTPRQTYLAWILLATAFALTLGAAVWYVWGIYNIKHWIEQKRGVKTLAKNVAEQTRANLEDAYRATGRLPSYALSPAARFLARPVDEAAAARKAYDNASLVHDAGDTNSNDATYRNNNDNDNNITIVDASAMRGTRFIDTFVANHPIMALWFGRVEEMRTGADDKGFVFVMDTRGNMWAHGKTKHLPWNYGMRNPEYNNLKESDNPLQNSTPAANFIRIGKHGGGYTYYRWKGNVLMMSYICPVKGTDLLIGVGVPVPNSHRVWNEMAVRNADVDSFVARPQPNK